MKPRMFFRAQAKHLLVAVVSVLCLPAIAADFVAYKVELDRIDAERIRFTDGSDAIFKNKPPELDSYYLDKAVIYRDAGRWTMCYEGKRYPLLRLDPPTNPKKREALDINVNQIELLPECY